MVASEIVSGAESSDENMVDKVRAFAGQPTCVNCDLSH